MSTAHDLPYAYAYAEPAPAVPALRLVPAQPLDFDDAVRRVRPRLHRYAIRRLGDVHEAEELVQEALLRAYSHREQLLTEEDLSAWTTVVTGRLVIDRLRVRGRSTNYADVPETGRLGRDTADIVVGRDEARTALDALDAMPPRQAALLWAREVEGQSYDELCTRFGMTEPAVRSVLTRARKALRKEYETRGGTLPVGGLAVLAPWITGMSWAGKLRSAVGRLTAPAALATVGITALGGLIVSPFGGSFGDRPSTFSPGTAEVSVASVPAVAEPVLHGFAVPTSTVTLVRLPSARGSWSADARPPAADQRVYDVYKAATAGVPCTQAPPSVAGRPLPEPIGAGNGQCQQFQRVRVTLIPSNGVTGSQEVAADSSELDCSYFEPAKALPNQPVTCTPKETSK